MEFLMNLENILKQRKKELPQGSYTARLFQEGEDRILKKIIEEAGEVLLAIKGGQKKEIIHESADLIFHLMVALVEKDISLEEVVEELKRRHK
ncbi:MAG: phosphoribosyl-ATP diphosphatase [Leptospiraceae bacterium]|jgi:phosphoribosyl-ATP pyrophosphohydrolase/phosphoribosyl-ATP pyrophosphohydrolase/phosphoribosyl-AMP cyclohydrolase|nr:phosphoribosyl-ATP diphosphatase [Leptospiraceae bacterium]